MPFGRATSFDEKLPSISWFQILVHTGSSGYMHQYVSIFFGFEVLSCPFHLNTPNDRGDMWRWNPPENDLHMEKGGGADGPNRAIQKGCMRTTFAKKS